MQERDAEYQQLRRRVSEQGARLRAALDGQVAAQQDVEDLRVAAAADLAALAAERDRERKRAEAERRRPRTPSPRSPRPGRPPGRRGSPTRCASGCCSTRSAARWPG